MAVQVLDSKHLPSYQPAGEGDELLEDEADELGGLPDGNMRNRDPLAEHKAKAAPKKRMSFVRGTLAKPEAKGRGLGIALCVMLLLQNAGVVLLLRYVRSTPGQNEFNTSTAVILCEVMKLAICAVLVAVQGDLKAVFADKKELLKVSLPAVVYLIGNNLTFVILSHISAPVYQCTYQIRNIVTAVFSVWLLKRTIVRARWVALGLLLVGVVMVQISQISGTQNASASASQHYVTGVTLTVINSMLSSFGGVFFEMLLKDSSTSLWVRNLQLSIYSCVFGVLGMYTSSVYFAVPLPESFFHGYTNTTWFCVTVQAVGGLLTAGCLKYADNILKNFSLALSISLVSLGSALFLNLELSSGLLSGVAVVVASTVLYSNPDILASRCPSVFGTK
jgi:UDP-galactose transporter